MKGADTAGMKKFFSEVLCTDSEDILNDYFQNDVPIQSCGDLNIYEASQFKVFKRQLLIKNEDSVYKPLSTYLENYVNEILIHHGKFFIDKKSFLIHFDELGMYTLHVVVAPIWTMNIMEWGMVLFSVWDYWSHYCSNHIEFIFQYFNL